MDDEIMRTAETLLRHNVGMHRAAAILGISYPTLRSRLNKTGRKPITVTVMVPMDYEDHIPVPEKVHALLGKKSPGKVALRRILDARIGDVARAGRKEN